MTLATFAEGRIVLDAQQLTIERYRKPALVYPRRDIRQVSVVNAKSFRHPVIGFAFATAFLVPSVWLLVTAWLGAGIFAAPRVGEAALFGTAFGAWLLYDVLTSPVICWLCVRTPRCSDRIPLPGVNSSEVELFVGAFHEMHP